MSEVRNERPRKSRKDIIKDIAIAFLTILLLLTFFSNTIMNYSLPEVAIQQIVNGTISPMIRGTGTVEAADPYKVKVTQERVIKSVAVAVGDKVKKGDVIYYLEDKESTELKDAQSKLDDLLQTYESSLFSGDISDETITRIRTGGSLTFDQYQAKLKAATQYYKDCKAADEAAQAAIDELSQAQSYTSAQYNYNQATPGYQDAEITYRLTELDIDIGHLEEAKAAQKEIMDDTKKTAKERANAEKEYWILDQQLDAKQDEKDSLNLQQASGAKDVTQITNEAGQVDSDFSRKMASLQDTKNKTAEALEKATTERSELITEISKEIELDSQRDEISKQKETIEKLQKESKDANITAPVDGKISSLALKAGESTNPDSEVAVIQVEGKGMVCSFAVTIDQAKNLKVGDIAEPQNAWYYTDFKATLTNIAADPNNPNTKKMLTFNIQSTEVQNGQSVSLQVGQKSDNYDLTVPAGSIREDSNGKFILIVQSKSSPLGNRYIAQRVDVEILASDDTTAAISGSLEGDEYVITTATSPINAGDQVRLANNT